MSVNFREGCNYLGSLGNSGKKEHERDTRAHIG